MSAQFNPVGWFDIPVTDTSRAVTFCQHVFGLRLELHDLGPLKRAWFPLKDEHYGAAGSLVHGAHYVPGHGGTPGTL